MLYRMSRISKKNFERIASDVASALYSHYPVPLTTRAVAREVARDNEFTKRVLLFLESRKIVLSVKKDYERWVKWKLSKAAKRRMDSGPH